MASNLKIEELDLLLKIVEQRRRWDADKVGLMQIAEKIREEIRQKSVRYSPEELEAEFLRYEDRFLNRVERLEIIFEIEKKLGRRCVSGNVRERKLTNYVNQITRRKRAEYAEEKELEVYEKIIKQRRMFCADEETSAE